MKILAAISAGFALALLAGQAGRYYVPAQPDAAHFWSAKAHAGPVYDLVLAGDSRLYRGLLPAGIGSGIAAPRNILNYGFSSAGLTPAYLEDAAGKLRPDAVEPAILIGVTAFSLTPQAALNQHWQESRAARVPSPAAGWRQFGPWQSWTDSLVTPPGARVQRAVRSQAAAVFEEQFLPDGAVPTIQLPLDPVQALPVYAREFQGNKVSDRGLAGLADEIRRLKTRGIRIFAVRPPATPRMDALEQAAGGYDELAIRRALVAAGAEWIEVNRTGYESYDGSHLDAEAAGIWSREVGVALRNHGWGR